MPSNLRVPLWKRDIFTSESYQTHAQRLTYSSSGRYRGRKYFKDKYELAPMQLKQEQIGFPGVANAWQYNPCPFCASEDGMNGVHLLQCESLPPR